MDPSKNEQQAKSRPRISAKDAKIATVLVGPNKDKFNIHEDLLTYHSPYFRAALTGSFKEAEEKIITLEDEDTQIFEFFVHWLYYDRFPNKKDSSDLYKKWFFYEDGSGKTLTYPAENVIFLYVFSDKFQVQRLRDFAMNELFFHIEYLHRRLPNAESVTYAFRNLPGKDPLCRYLVDAFVHSTKINIWTGDDIEEFDLEFVSKVLEQYHIYVAELRKGVSKDSEEAGSGT